MITRLKSMTLAVTAALLVSLLAAIPASGAPSSGATDFTSRAGTVIDVGAYHNCAILSDATLKCWGENGDGQLGQDDVVERGEFLTDMGANLAPIDLGAGRTAAAVSAGDRSTCAILDNGTVKCWGDNFYGELGQDHTDNIGDGIGTAMADLNPINLGTGRTATAISAGTAQTCAILDNGTVKCWGRNTNGQLGQDSVDHIGNGIGTAMADLNPINLGTGRTATAISAGFGQTCAILDNGTVKCWGDNRDGQLGQDSVDNIGNGIGTAMADLNPINLGTGRTATAISASDDHTCAILDNGTVKCWGDNRYGELGQDSVDNIGDGIGTAMADLNPINLGAGRTATAISAGKTHSCAILNNGTAKCWGRNVYGQLGQGNGDNVGDGIGDPVADIDPIDFGTGRTPLGIATDGPDGDGTTCFLLSDYTLSCFGYNFNHQLGIGIDGNSYGNLPGQMGDNLPALDLDGRVRPIQIQCPTTPAHGFADVPATSFADGDVTCIKELAITTGTSATTYSPGDTVTREQMAAFIGRLWRALDQTCPTTPAHGFIDVPASSFAVADITCIKALEITTGTSATTYSPANTVTREQMAAFLGRLWRALGNTCPTTPAHGFIDVPASSFANADITCIKALGITTGTSATTYSPANTVTREQMAAFIGRIITANTNAA